MARLRDQVIRAGLETLYFSGAHRLIRHFCEGVGIILTLHHVRPARPDAFQPNHILEITPQFLSDVIAGLRQTDVDLVSLDEMHRRLSAGDFARRFACLTFDDGYRDNKVFAYPILKQHAVPFAIYIPTSFMDRSGELWWVVLESIIASQDEIIVPMNGEVRTLSCHGTEAKQGTFATVYWWLRSRPTETEIRDAMHALAHRYAIDARAICDDLCLTWDELGELAADPLVTIGAHTINHPILAKTPVAVARKEIDAGRAAIKRHLGVQPQHFSFPFGDASSAGPREFELAQELGFKTAVTTRPGVLFPEHRDHLMALPRVSINGDYQKMRYVDVLVSGAATAFWNGFRRVNAA